VKWVSISLSPKWRSFVILIDVLAHPIVYIVVEGVVRRHVDMMRVSCFCCVLLRVLVVKKAKKMR